MKTDGDLRHALVKRVQAWFSDEREEDLGDLAADTVLSWIEDDLAPVYYNRGITDARDMLDQRIAGVYDDLDTFERVLPPDLRPRTDD